MKASPKVSARTKSVPAAMYAGVLFLNGEFRGVSSFGFNREAAKAFVGGTGSVRGLSAELIEVPLVPQQVAAIEAAIEQAIEAETRRGFSSAA